MSLPAYPAPSRGAVAASDGVPGTGGLEPVDFARPPEREHWFVCETTTPLFYTASYAKLTDDQRRAYGRLHGMYCNELIAFFEQSIARPVLVRLAEGRVPDHLRSALDRFRREEDGHTELFRRLNRLSRPDWYTASDRRLLEVPAAAARAIAWLTRRPETFPVVLWIMLAMEERGMEFARRCLRLGDRLEPRYAAVYRLHLRDEAWHVRMDCELLERLYRPRGAAARRMNAALFRWAMAAFFVTPTRSAIRVVGELAGLFPALRPLRPAMVRELRGVAGDARYHASIHSREATPVTFGMFDRHPEMRGIGQVLRAYAPPAGPASGPG